MSTNPSITPTTISGAVNFTIVKLPNSRDITQFEISVPFHPLTLGAVPGSDTEGDATSL